MRYFHRTSVSPETVLSEADRHFGGTMTTTSTGPRLRRFAGIRRAAQESAETPAQSWFCHVTRVSQRAGDVNSGETSKGSVYLTGR
jgi:hypothetical protein